MGLLSNPIKSRRGRASRLPLYEKVHKERLSDDEEDYYASSDDSDRYDSPSSHDASRKSSSSQSSAALMLPKHSAATIPARRVGRPYFYRLPNRIVRYLCLGLVLFITLMIMTLVRASVNENKRIAEGKVEKAPDPPPVWEQFDFLTRYYGGIRNLVPLSENPAQYPRARDEVAVDELDIDLSVNKTSEDGVDDAVRRGLPESKPFFEHERSVFKLSPQKFNECFLDAKNKHHIPPIRYYQGRPKGFPNHVLGSYDLLNLPEDICYERFGRYGPYGFGYSSHSGGLGVGAHGEQEGADSVWEDAGKIDYREVDWADAQRRCYKSNMERYKEMPARPATPRGFYIDDLDEKTPVTSPPSAGQNEKQEPETGNAALHDKRDGDGTDSIKEDAKQEKMSRTAIVVRAWDEFTFRPDDMLNLRSMITELSLASGGRYDIHLLVQVKNEAAHPVWADEEAYRQHINDTIPAEFQGLVTLWSETQMLSLYQGMHDLFARGPDLPVHGVYRGLTMAMQYFASQHPEYDYYWSWEMDVRYTGHYYDLFSKLENWSSEQPRKGLWERNARYYLPDVHGSWDEFHHMVRVQTDMGTTSPDNVWKNVPGLKEKPANKNSNVEKPIWGPQRSEDEDDWFDTEIDPKPPTTYEQDKYTWGVGEEADLIALNPIFDPEGTTWGLAEDVTGYNKNDRSKALPPRRAHIITASRLSRRLLMTMHRETAYKKHFAFPEMWPATVAFQHGFKAVFAPHPQFVDREWPTAYFAQVLNAGKNGASGGARMSVFGQREHNLRGLTWFYNSGFGPNLYRRWLGMKVNNDGGEEFELEEDETKNGTTVGQMRGGEGRMCLPPMLIHPVKEVELPVEEAPKAGQKEEVPESDPNA